MQIVVILLIAFAVIEMTFRWSGCLPHRASSPLSLRNLPGRF